MAKIPGVNDFGNAAPQLSRMQPQAGNVTAVSDAVARLGQTGMAIATKVDQNQRAIKVAGASAQAERDMITWFDEHERDQDFDSHDERYEQYVESIKTQHAETFKDDPRALNIFNEQLKEHTFKVGRKVTARAIQGKIGRQQIETDQTLSDLSTVAANHLIKGETDDFQNVMTRAETIIDMSAENGVLTTEEAAQRKQSIRANISLSEAQNDLTTNPAGLIEKMGSDGYSGIEGNDRITLTNRARAEIEHQKSKAVAAQKTADTELVSDAILAYQSGDFVSTEDLTAANESAARLGVNKQEDLLVARATSEYILLPKHARENFDAKIPGLSNAEQRDAMDKAESQIDAAVKADGYSYGLQQKKINPIELNIQDPASFSARVKQAEFLTNHYGKPVSPLTDDEAGTLVRGLELMSPQDKADLAVAIGDSDAIWAQLDKKNAGLFAMTGAIGDKSIMENVFKGQQLMKDGLAATLSKNDYLPEFDDVVGNVYVGKDRRDMLSASLAYYAATSDSADFAAGDFGKAIEAVSGGIGKINGFKIELPRDVSEDMFDDYIDDFTPEMAAAFGTATGYTNEQVAEAVQKGRVVSMGNNRYFVVDNRMEKSAGGKLVDVETGKDFIISFDISLYEAQQKDVALDDSTRRTARGRAVLDAQKRQVRIR